MKFPILACSLILALAAVAPAAGRPAPTLRTPGDITPIGTIQGPIPAAPAGGDYPSPLLEARVTVRAIVHGLYLRTGRRNKTENGFFLQNATEQADGLPETSDGIFVYTQRNPTIKTVQDTFYQPRIGDEIILSGKVREMFDQTQLTVPRLQEVVRTGVNPARHLPTIVIPDFESAREAAVFYERHEGMRVTIPADSIVCGPRKVFGSSNDAEAYLVPDGSPWTARQQPYHRRVFRDAHPLDDRADTRFDNGNPTRILVGSRCLKGAAGDTDVMIPPLRTFDRLTSPAPGIVAQWYESHPVHLVAMPAVTAGPNPAINGWKAAPDPHHLTVATFNVENLYDFVDDPDDPCDARDDPGNSRVQTPFNYLPGTQGEYAAKLQHLALQIVHGLHAPDILLLQEIEDQDLRHYGKDGALDSADGELDSLQDLAAAIAAAGGPAYQTAADRDGAGYRGITSGFLYRPDKVRMPQATPDHPVLGSQVGFFYRGKPLPCTEDVENPKALNAALHEDVDDSTGIADTNVFPRAVQVAWFQVENTNQTARPADLYILNNHFCSRPNERIKQRHEESAYNRLIVETLRAVHPDAGIIVGGDLNVYPRPDDPQVGEPTDQLGALYDAGLHNLYDGHLESAPQSAYSYVYRGQAGTLDQLFVNDAMKDRLVRFWVGHFNSDWPDDYEGDGSFGASDHDPVIATFTIGTSD